MMELTKERLQQIVNAAGLEPCDYEEVFDGVTTGEIVKMARQLLAGIEQEPVAWMFKEYVWATGLCGYVWREKLEIESPGAPSEAVKDITPLYAAPQLPQPAVVPEQMRYCQGDDAEDDSYKCGWNACRAAMRQGKADSAPATDNTTQKLEARGISGRIVTSDAHKMELPRCHKHPETELQVNPFEQLMSYPPQPKMYCPECEPWIDERINLDKQIRRARETK